jgi:hypothetical protein
MPRHVWQASHQRGAAYQSKQVAGRRRCGGAEADQRTQEELKEIDMHNSSFLTSHLLNEETGTVRSLGFFEW